jgi:hypothetical protein
MKRPARCDVCGDVVATRHPWDVQACSCGRLTLSGGPKHRQVRWRAEPGTGWTDLDEALDSEAVTDDDNPEASDHDDAEPEGAHPDEGAPPEEHESAGAGSGRLTPRLGHGGLDRAPVDRLPLEEQPDHAIEGGPVVAQQSRRPLLGFTQ